MAGRLEFEFRVPGPAAVARSRRREDDPFRILVVGDFHGDGVRSGELGLEERAVVPVDIDNFERVLARMAPRIGPVGGTTAEDAQEIAFAALDDFHPDTLFTRLDGFADLRRLRERLLDPDSFEAAAAALADDGGGSGAPATGRSPGDDVTEDTGTMFERLLGGRPAAAETGPSVRGEGYATQLIERLIAPHVEPGVDNDRQRLLVAAVDDRIAARMRAVLHDPRLQKLEAAWRGLWWLVSSLETGPGLQIHLLDASRDELMADLLRDDGDIGAAALYRLLVGGDADTPDSAGWSLLIGADRFGPSDPELRLLAALGAIASHAGGPFVAAADPAMLGAASLADQPDPADWTSPDAESEQRWHALRRSAVAPWLGLALPRVLLRLPYGGRSDPVERFAFEEMAATAGHESLLWGSPAFACALLLGRSFADNGWDMEPGTSRDLDDLPAYTFDEDGETKLKPCAEVLLSHRAADSIMARGIMPVLSHRDRNAVRLASIQSIADPAVALCGPWR